METKSLLYGIIGFILGGLLVSIASVTFENPDETVASNEMTMSQMTNNLNDVSGDDYDKLFIANMIEHHKSAVDMAKLSASRAKHEEIQKLSKAIIAAQEKEIYDMKQWQEEWGYKSTDDNDSRMMNDMMH